METALLIAAVAVAGLACPAMMWWQRRRGRDAACCMPDSSPGRSPEADELRRRQAALSARIAELTNERPAQLAGTGRREPAGDG